MEPHLKSDYDVGRAEEEDVRIISTDDGKDTRARLIRIKQEGTYIDYLKKFVAYSAPLPNMAESVLIDAFMNELKPDIRAEVTSRLERCMREAQL